MQHDSVTDEIRELASMYALGVLSAKPVTSSATCATALSVQRRFEPSKK
jgi:hypothetical protein